MGCDIHMHTEVKINGRWLHYGHPIISRNYKLFALLADVRNGDGEIEPISLPKGMPEDASDITRLECKREGNDGHSHSYLTASEITELEKRLGEIRYPHESETLDLDSDIVGYLSGNSWARFDPKENDHPPEYEDVRFVFWFDN